MQEAQNLTAEEVATRLRVSTITLARWRCKGTGPEYIKAGGRVLYNEDDVAAYEAGNKRSKTRDTE